MNYKLISRALTLSSTRFIALSLGLCDMIMLGHQGAQAVKTYAVSSQIAQVFVILGVVLSLGINIVIGKSDRDREDKIQNVFYYSICLSLGLFVISLMPALFVQDSKEILLSYLILSLSILPLCIYIGCANVLETIGLEKRVLLIMLFGSIVNALLNYLFIKTFDDSAIAVSLSTFSVRLLVLFPVVALLIKKGVKLAPKRSRDVSQKLLRLGRPEAITSLFFTGGLSLLVLYVARQMETELMASFGLSLNYMNTFVVIFVGLGISLTISLSENKQNYHFIFQSLQQAMLYILVVSALLYVVTPLLSYVYLGHISDSLTTYFRLSIVIITFDGIATVLISTLRVYGHSQIPPLSRLSLILVGIPLSFVVTVHDDPIANIIIFMAIGNLLAILICGLYIASNFSLLKQNAISPE